VYLRNRIFMLYYMHKIKYVLIKSDGGNRPDDVRQPTLSKVPNPAVKPIDEVVIDAIRTLPDGVFYFIITFLF